MCPWPADTTPEDTIERGVHHHCNAARCRLGGARPEEDSTGTTSFREARSRHGGPDAGTTPQNRASAFGAEGIARFRRCPATEGEPELRFGVEDREPLADRFRGEDPTGTTSLREARSRRGGPDAGATAQEPRFGVRGGRQRPCPAGSADRGRAGSAFRSGRTGRLRADRVRGAVEMESRRDPLPATVARRGSGRGRDRGCAGRTVPASGQSSVAVVGAAAGGGGRRRRSPMRRRTTVP